VRAFAWFIQKINLGQPLLNRGINWKGLILKCPEIFSATDYAKAEIALSIVKFICEHLSHLWQDFFNWSINIKSVVTKSDFPDQLFGMLE